MMMEIEINMRGKRREGDRERRKGKSGDLSAIVLNDEYSDVKRDDLSKALWGLHCVRAIGRIHEAALIARSYLPSKVSEIVSIWRNDLNRVNKNTAESLADPQECPNLFKDWQVSLALECKDAENRHPPSWILSINLVHLPLGQLQFQDCTLTVQHLQRYQVAGLIVCKKSSEFSRGASMYRRITRCHQHGRWLAKIGKVTRNKDLYLGHSVSSDTYLDRAWRGRPQMVYAYTRMTKVVNPAGWSDNNHPECNKLADYVVNCAKNGGEGYNKRRSIQLNVSYSCSYA
ncbi:hypothetical protein DVH24_028031 [Malus domestica]|uniref:Uncharacterized protein n=1 Tax=Malus domestica TaxID=3750 RepID=A0A498HC74_MALDO|nr:hypothetical protein DVH24_028031 [Malus domestica]